MMNSSSGLAEEGLERIREFSSDAHIQNIWRKNCPVCRQPMAKKNPTDVVPCSCGKYVWKG
jgi:ribosomal protein L37AE/L43A